MNWPLIVSWLLVLAPVVWLLYVLAKWHRHAVYMRKLEEQRQSVLDLGHGRAALARGLATQQQREKLRTMPLGRP